MLKRLEKESSKLAQNKLFLPGFPENSLPFLFFFSPPGPPDATTESPLHPPTDPHTRTALTHLSPPLDFLLPLSNPPQGTTPSLAKPNRGSPLPFLSFSSSSPKETLSHLPPINTTPATPPAASSAVTASTGASLRLPASSPANSSPPSSSDAQQQPK